LTLCDLCVEKSTEERYTVLASHSYTSWLIDDTSAQEAYMKKNSVGHFEIYADKVDTLAQFYSSLFDWSIEKMPNMDYHWIKTTETDEQGMPTKPGGINGGMIARPAGYGDRAWVNYVNVDSVDAAVAKATQLGAKVTKEKGAVPGMGWFAMFVDPEGNPFAVWQMDSNAK
jgi:predicted enzyme related to lactoylglutathione lyase